MKDSRMSREMEVLTDNLERQSSLLFRACHPRSIQPPVGYADPRHYATMLVGDLLAVLNPQTQLLSHATAYMNALMLIANRVPTYFISYEFAHAVANTSLPGDFKFAELKWPMEAQLFVLPDKFVYEYYGCYAPFLSVSRCFKGIHPRGKMPKLEIELMPCNTENDKIAFDYPFYPPEGMPTDYNGNYHLTMGIDSFKGAPWCDSTPYERALADARFGKGTVNFFNKHDLSKKDEDDFINNAMRLAVKLMLCVAARPGSVEHGRVTVPARTSKGRITMREVWSANVIGRGYQIPRRYAERAVTTGQRASPRFVFRRGHWTWQAVRRKDVEFVSVEQMPHMADTTSPPEEISKVGLIDFDTAGPELSDKFRACHDRQWIEGFLFGDTENGQKEGSEKS